MKITLGSCEKMLKEGLLGLWISKLKEKKTIRDGKTAIVNYPEPSQPHLSFFLLSLAWQIDNWHGENRN